MPNLFDYLEWRGDLTLEDIPLCEVDNLAFCLLSYVNLDGIVPTDPKKGSVTIREAAAEYFFTHPTPVERPLGLIIPAEILQVFRRMALVPRFRDLRLTGYVNTISEEREMQFSAVTVLLPKESMFVAFRGTDDSIVGWREDFNLSFMDEVPSQRKAADYLNHLDRTPETTLYVGGHSKGGNLAVWGAVHAEEAVRRCIVQVYSNDGPGFSEGTVASDAYKALSDRIRVILPDDSLVGLLLEHDDRYTVIRSNRKGIFQHNGLSWEVMGSSFVRSEGLSKKGLHADTEVRARIDSMSRAERQQLVHIMFTLLESTGAKTLTDLHNERFKAALTMIKTFGDLTPTEQETAAYLWEKLVGGKLQLPKRSNPRNKPNPKTKHPKGDIRISFFPLFTP